MLHNSVLFLGNVQHCTVDLCLFLEGIMDRLIGVRVEFNRIIGYTMPIPCDRQSPALFDTSAHARIELVC